MSGVDIDGRSIRKGAADAIALFLDQRGASVPTEVAHIVEDVAKRGATPLVVSDENRVLGVVQLKDVVKGGIRERFADLRRIGIRT
jgi:K+-transporting ATPase ATPase B chain